MTAATRATSRAIRAAHSSATAAHAPVRAAARRRAARAAIMLPYQRRWIADNSPMKIWEKSRRIGADYCEAYKVAHSRISGERPVDYYYSSNDEEAAREFMEYVAFWSRIFGMACEVIDDSLTVGEITVQVFRIEFKGCGRGRAGSARGRVIDPKAVALSSNPKAFRSKGGDVTISELAFHGDAAALWRAAVPCVTWGGRFACLSSHHGETSLFNARVDGARRHADPLAWGAPRPFDVPMSLHRTSIHDAVADGLCERICAVSGTSATREEFIADLRARCGDADTWREEYECVPSIDSGSYFPYETLRIVTSARDPLPTENLALFLAGVAAAGAQASALYAGCDIGRRRDLFALHVWGVFGGGLRSLGTLRFTDRLFGEMELAIRALMRLRVGEPGRSVSLLCIDETGIGMQLAENMRRAHGRRVEAVTFTAAVKADLATLARSKVDERTITLPDDPQTLAAWNAIRRTVTSAGNVRFDGDSEAGHADEFWAAALGLHAAAARPCARAVRVEEGFLS